MNTKEFHVMTDIKDIIDACRKQYGNDLYGGNCGMFALALSSYLGERGIESRLIVFSDYDEAIDGTPESPRSLMDVESSVYHVAIGVGDSIYDGDGENTKENILDWISAEYEDFDVSVLDWPSGDKNLESLIRNDTDWTYDKSEFMEFISRTESRKNQKTAKSPSP